MKYEEEAGKIAARLDSEESESSVDALRRDEVALTQEAERELADTFKEMLHRMLRWEQSIGISALESVEVNEYTLDDQLHFGREFGAHFPSLDLNPSLFVAGYGHTQPDGLFAIESFGLISLQDGQTLMSAIHESRYAQQQSDLGRSAIAFGNFYPSLHGVQEVMVENQIPLFLSFAPSEAFTHVIPPRATIEVRDQFTLPGKYKPTLFCRIDNSMEPMRENLSRMYVLGGMSPFSVRAPQN